MDARRHHKSMKTEAWGARGQFFYDLGRLFGGACFVCVFGISKKPDKNPQNLGIQAPQTQLTGTQPKSDQTKELFKGLKDSFFYKYMRILEGHTA